MDEDVVYTDIYTAEYYLTFKKKEILSFVTTQKIPEDIRLSEISQTQKDKNSVISLTCRNLNSLTHRSRVWNSACQGLGKRGGEDWGVAG